jgi:hypothetical protein
LRRLAKQKQFLFVTLPGDTVATSHMQIQCGIAMEPDWNQVKKQTLWTYEDLIKKLLDVLAYGFVQEHYNHTMQEAKSYSLKIQQGYLQNQNDTTFIDNIIASLQRLESLQVETYLDLIHRVETREKCVTFLQKTGFHFEELIQTLNYVFRWVLPFKNPVREFIDVDNDTHKTYLAILKQHKLGSNLDILEHCRTRVGRTELSKVTGIPEVFILGLVHRADISRLAYVRGKTVKHLCGGGYDTLDKIANADLERMEEEMDAYYRTIGKSLADFKSVIPLPWMIGGAKTLPRIVEE